MNSAQLSIRTGTRQLRLTDRDVEDIERLLLLLGALPNEGDEAEREQAALQTLAVRIHSARALRGKYLPPTIFGEAAWDVLLALYALDDNAGGLDMICEGVLQPMKSTLRWVDYLEDDGLVVRSDSPGGPIVKLTGKGRVAIEAYLRRLFKWGQ